MFWVERSQGFRDLRSRNMDGAFCMKRENHTYYTSQLIITA